MHPATHPELDLTMVGAMFRCNPRFPVRTVKIMRGPIVTGMGGFLPQTVEELFFGKDRLRGVKEVFVRRKSA